MPYQPTNPYPYNTGLDIENGLTLYFKVDNYDIINSFKVEIHDVYKEKLLYSIIRSVGEIADNKVIEGDKQIIEIYDKQNEQVYIDYYGKKSSLPVIGGQGVQSICELELTDYLMKIEDIEKTKYYNNTENAVNLQIAPAEMFTYDETGTEITGINTDYEGYENYMADLVIPYKNTTKVGNPLIVSIGEEAISKSGYRMITHLTIPNSVIEIKNKAFSSCQISTLNLNYGTNIIGEQAFESTGIQELFLVDSIEQIGISAFAGCSTLQKVTFSSRLKKIPDSCFYNTRIKDIIIPDTVEIIGDNAFNVIDSGGADTAILQLGKNVKSIGMSAFLQQKFTEVIIPESVEEIKESAFFANASLKKFICKGKNISFGKNVLGNCNIEELTIPYIKEHNLLGYLFSGAVTTQTISNEAVPSTLTSVTLTNADKIPDEMFSKCSEILNYSLNEGIISIGTKAFYNDCKMQSIIIPSTVTEIGKQAFAVDEGIILDSTIEFNFTDSKQSLIINEKAFSNNIAIKAIQIPNRTVTIGLGAFEGCSNLTTIILPFVGKEKMQVTNGEPTLTGKEGYYFDYIFGNQRATQDKTCEKIPSSLRTVVITDNCKMIPPYAFYNETTTTQGGSSNITTINISSYTTTIYKYAFYNCGGLSGFTIPVKCTYIGEFALQYKLNEAVSYTWYSDIPYNIDSVESPVFTLQLIDNWVDLNTASFLGNMFLDITTSPYKQYVLQTGNVPKNDTGRVEKSNIDTEIVAYYTELYKYLINKEKETIIKQNDGICGDNITYTLMRNEITGKNIITLKGQGKMFDYDDQSNISPFAKIQNIEEINMEDSLITYIGNYSFSNLLESTEYTTVKFPLTLQQIGDYAFYNRRLINDKISEEEYHLDFSNLNNLTTIGISAFEKAIYFENPNTQNKVIFSKNLKVMKGNSINNFTNMNELIIPIVYPIENGYDYTLQNFSSSYYTKMSMSSYSSDSIKLATALGTEFVLTSSSNIIRSLHIIEGGQVYMGINYLSKLFMQSNFSIFEKLEIDKNVNYLLISSYAMYIPYLECYCGGDNYFYEEGFSRTSRFTYYSFTHEETFSFDYLTRVNNLIIKGFQNPQEVNYLPFLNFCRDNYEFDMNVWLEGKVKKYLYGKIGFSEECITQVSKYISNLHVNYIAIEELNLKNLELISIFNNFNENLTALDKIILPKTVKRIEDGAFFCKDESDGVAYSSVKVIEMEEDDFSSLEYIGDKSFYCTGKGWSTQPSFSHYPVCQFVLGDNLKYIGDYAFSGRTNFSFVVSENNAIESIGENAFEIVESYKTCSFYLGKKLKQIKTRAFSNAKNFNFLASLDNTIETIGSYAFQKVICNDSSQFVLGSNLQLIDHDAFNGAKNFKFIFAEENTFGLKIEYHAFCDVTEKSLPNSIPNYVIYFGSRALGNWLSEYEEVSLPFLGQQLNVSGISSVVKLEYIFNFKTSRSWQSPWGRNVGYLGSVGNLLLTKFNIGNTLKKINITKATTLPQGSLALTRSSKWSGYDTQSLVINMTQGSEKTAEELRQWALKFPDYSSNNKGADDIETSLVQITISETASGQSAKKSNQITNNKISVLSEEEDITPIEEVRAMANEAATTTDKKILKIENDRKYDWKLYLYGKKFDVYVTDNNTYADKSSYIPKVYLPKNSQMKEGQEIIFKGEDKYLISDIQNFNYTNKIFYRQSRGVLEGQLSYYSLLTGILTYDETNPANPWIIDADLKPYLLSTPVNFSTGSTYDKDLDKGTISIDGEDIINVNLNDKTSTEEYTKGVRITLQKTILTQAYLPTDLIDMATIGTSFTIGTDNSLQTITKIDDYYTVTVSPGFEVITNGYTSSRIVIANKNLILPQDLNTNQVVIVVDVSGKLSLEGDLYEVVKQGTIDKKLCSLIKVGVTTFELPNITSVGTTTYIITKVDSTTGKINFEDSSGNGYSIKRSDNQNYDIVLFNYLDISDEDFDTTDLHVTLNYINIYDVNKISLYASGDTEEGKLLNLKEHEILYLIECSSVVNATDYQVNERSMEKEAVLERYCSIVTVTNLDGSIPNSVRIPGDTWYFIYSNYIETPGYYFETVTEQPVKITINDEVIEKSEEGTYSYTLTSGIGNFLAEYKGNVSSYSWTLFEDYGGEYIEIANKQDTYSAYLFYDYFLFEDNKRYKIVLQIVTNEGLIVSYTIIINTAFNNEITLSNIYVEKECDKEKAIKIDLDKKVINIDSSSSIKEAKVKSYYIIRRLANNHGVEDTVLAYVEDVAEFYDYSFKREDTYEYYVLPIYLVGDKEYRGVPALCQTIDKTNKIRYDLRLIVLKNTVMDYEELFKTSKIENSFEAETGEYDTWILKYNSEANNADIITDKATYDSISQFATVNKTKRNYKTGNITALLGKMHTDNEQFTYKDSILLQNKLQAFANNGKIKMLRDEIGNVMPVDITLKSFEYNPKAIPSTIAVSFEWTQLADEKTFSVYKTIGVKEG